MIRPIPIGLMLLSLLPAIAGIAQAQTPSPAAQEDWEGKVVSEIRADRAQGWKRHHFRSAGDTLQLRKGQRYDKTMRDTDHKTLFKTNWFSAVDISVAKSGDKWIATVSVTEYQIITDVIFSGIVNVPMQTLRPQMRLGPNDELNPYLLKVDEDTLRAKYVEMGYLFFSVTPEIVETDGGVILNWQVTEGPLVTVKDVIITGIPEADADKFRHFLANKGDSVALGFIPVSGSPYVQKYVNDDLERIKLFLYFDGWLDIASGERVFLEDLSFSRDKREVTITIHVDRGRRYRIRKVAFEGEKLFTEAQLRDAITSKEGTEYSDNSADRDARTIKDLYGERAYILAEVKSEYVLSPNSTDVDLTFSIIENREVTVGQIVIQGNTKTRYDVILRELKDFAPGDKFNNRLLNKGIGRLLAKGYFDPQAAGHGVTWHTEPGITADERDVIIDVKEGPTGNLKFAGGYSSNFGVLGIIEFTQRNFDIANVPSGFDDFFGGGAFAGGGQTLRLRASPSAKRQSYLADFREPYVFGYEFGAGVSALNITTNLRSWTEERTGLVLSVDKRFDPFLLKLKLDMEEIDIGKISVGAPADAFDVEGKNYLLSLTPSIGYDNRDIDLFFPVNGVMAQLSYEMAGGPFGGDWEFGKLWFEAEVHFPMYEYLDKTKHVLSFQLKTGWARPQGDDTALPLFERFFAGGRDSVRGFDFRGMGPHDNGDPVGGNALLIGTIEYTVPLYDNFIRAALFYDVANIAQRTQDFGDDKFRNVIGFGFKFVIPQIGNIPVSLDFGFPLSKEPEDERQTVTFDIGKLF